MIKSFGQIFRENNLYIRPDPDSENAKFYEETGIDMDVGASLIKGGNKYHFIWRRSKSNLNLLKHNFTHYLTRIIYVDEKRVLEGQKINKETVSLKSDEGNTGLLCSLPLEELGIDIDDCQQKESDLDPLPVLYLIRQREHFEGRIRLISCYPTDNKKYIEWYSRNYYNWKPKKQRDSLEIKDISDGTQTKLSEQENFKRAIKASEEVRENLIREMMENLTKGYNIFMQKFGVV